MNKRSCWVAAFLGLLLFAGGASEADPAREALKKGKACLDIGEFDSAIAAITEAIRLNPECAQAYYNRGTASGMKGEFDEAILDLTEAIRLSPKDADAYHARGETYAKKGEKAKAEEDFAQAKKLGYRAK